MTLLQYILLFGSVIAGGVVAFILRKINRNTLQLVLAFSGAYILGITVLHLLPNVFFGGSHTTGLWLLLGFFIQLLLEQLSGGLEHGHLHVQEGANWRVAVTIMIGLCLHAFMEGLPLAGYSSLHAAHHSHHQHSEWHLLIGIILHKVPAAFALVILMLLSGFRQRVVVLSLLIFSSMSPLGAALASFLNWDLETQRLILALVVGSFLHISTTILFESDNSTHHRIPWRKLLAIIAGLGMSIFTLIS
jgi:zinc transporter ZupT